MTYFDRALKHYVDHRQEAAKQGKQLYKFSTYFTWWARESIRTYLGIAENPLEGIIPRME